ncbi:hypothetical protein F0562_035618 [Nyssa sinensis]|uniref:non-specific serine/threonine protein kinase n=1 Tax=Nyssa sinensis TaxID=561372 RepID=A0A5J5AG01_9ASTE|nr:hypothetical protein F0562_035618 [Nyssa sinensis]
MVQGKELMAYPLPHLLLILLLLLPSSSFAQTNGNVTVGASLTATDEASSWPSPSGDFAFGFRQLENKELFLLSIWYDKIPERTIVWHANGDNPAPSGSKVQLTADHGLVLNDPRGEELWRSDSTGVVAFGFMNDTGNFELANENSEKIWESFSQLTDTLLPTQKMERGGVLSSRLSETNFSRGRFQLRLLSDGNLVLNVFNLLTNFAYEAYYSSATADPDPSNSGYQLIFNQSGSMYILKNNYGRFYLVEQVPEDCKKSCLHDCFCVVATLRDAACWKKRLPLSNGRVDSNLPGKAYIKIRRGNFPTQNSCLPIPEQRKNQDRRRNQDTFILVLSVLLGSSVLMNFILLGLACLGFFFIYPKKLTRESSDDVVKTNLRFFTYKELVETTNGFREELGRGSFGIVYKGEIGTGSRELVAVKKLDRLVQDTEKEFKTEVNVIGQTHHKNLVRLLGFCDEGPHRLLVYEFLSNGSLASFLFGNPKPSWKQRTQIAFGIARGLLYLHEECNTQIIHCDIKPQNILLDDYYNARISDFGLAKLLMMDQSQTHTSIRGTKGYVAPEWFRNLPITAKVDVYSFGVLLLEIICCRRSIYIGHGEGETEVLTFWAYDCYREGALDALVEYETEAIDDQRNLERFVMVAIWCIQEDPSLRPIMKKVIQMLEEVVEVPVPPCPSPFITC